ncbi:putative methyltransferase-domain-containing protein [Syncephalis fuscata]|nr:putative methyltransferase-domain-containing protein [Syncephalis fuscata]
MTTKIFCFGNEHQRSAVDDNNETPLSSESYNDANNEIQIQITEKMDPSFHCYVWPSALMLAEYIWYYRRQFKDVTVIELGAGTGLPGLLAAKLGSHVYLTDLPEAMPYLQEHIEENGLTVAASSNTEQKSHGWALPHPLKWGAFKTHGLLELITSISSLNWIIGADLFYDSKDFESVLVTVSYLLDYYPMARFITAYQERSAARTLQPLLDQWQLTAQAIAGDTFGWQPDAFASNTETTETTTAIQTRRATRKPITIQVLCIVLPYTKLEGQVRMHDVDMCFLPIMVIVSP